MAIYCGTDIIEIERLKKSIESVGGFKDRVFTPEEINYCESRKKSKYESYAARFAAKEAVMKALGTGMGEGIGFNHIEVLNNEKGKPYVILYQNALKYYECIRAKSLDISLSHCSEYAVAYAIIEVDA